MSTVPIKRSPDKPVVVRNFRRPDAELVKALGELGVATVHEAQLKTGMMRPYMRPIYPSARLAGSAVTVLCRPGDNLMIHAAVETCRPGDVVVVATTSETSDGMFGDLLAISYRAHGAQGLIIDAGVRDSADLAQMQFPVWAKAVNAQGPARVAAGSVNVPVICAGARVSPGDVIVADADGVVVVPRQTAAQVVELGRQRMAKEQATRERLARGELGVDFYGLREKLKELGVEYVERIEE